MSKILISINPIHTKNILKGVKKYEYRTKIAKHNVDSLIIYCTSPIKQVVAEVNIKKVIYDTPNKLWKKTKKYSGINKDFFDKYFFDRKIAYAYEISKVKVYDTPLLLSDFGLKCPPQSYCYIK